MRLRSRHLAFPLVALAAALAGCRSLEAARDHERNGAAYLKAGQIEQGVRELEAALEEDPGAVGASISLAAIYDQAGNPALAIDVLKKCIETHPNAHLARMGLGRIYAGLSELDKALEQYAAVGRSAGYAPAFLGMADIYEIRGEDGAAERAILAAIQTEPTSPTGRYRLARLYDRLGLLEARAAWERYLAAALGNTDERARIEEARARLLVLASTLSREEKAALLGVLRQQLATAPPALRGSLAAAEAGPIAADAGPAVLRRFYPGRLHVKLYVGGADPVRGAGSAATLYEAAAAAAEDVRKSRVFDLFYATALGRTRIEVDLEVGEPRPFAVEDRSGELVPRDGGPIGPDEAIGLALADRTITVLPSDRAALGLATLKSVLESAARQAGRLPDEWRAASLKRVSLRGFVEAADGGGEPVDLGGGLPRCGPVTRFEALGAARAGADWIAGLIGADGALASAYLPGDDRYAPATARTQAWAVIALADAGERLGDSRFADASRIAYAWLAAQPLTREIAPLAVAAAVRTGRTQARDAALAVLLPLQRTDGGFDGCATEEAALALATAAGTVPSLRPAALAALEAAGRRGGEVGAAACTAAALLGARGGVDPRLAAATARLKEREGGSAEAIEANVALALARLRGGSGAAPAAAAAAKPKGGGGAAATTVPPAGGPAPERLLAGAAEAALRLAVDARSGYPFRNPGRAMGGFRGGPFDPRISLEETARLVSALSLAAPYLPEDAGGAQ